MEVKYGAKTVKKTSQGYEWNALISAQGQIVIPESIRVMEKIEQGDILKMVMVSAVGRRAK